MNNINIMNNIIDLKINNVEIQSIRIEHDSGWAFFLPEYEAIYESICSNNINVFCPVYVIDLIIITNYSNSDYSWIVLSNNAQNNLESKRTLIPLSLNYDSCLFNIL